jgi:hypothetical protein
MQFEVIQITSTLIPIYNYKHYIVIWHSISGTTVFIKNVIAFTERAIDPVFKYKNINVVGLAHDFNSTAG